MAQKRKAAMHWIGDAVRAILQISKVEYRTVAGLNPDVLNLPSCYIFRGADPMEDLTNMEREARMRVHVIVFVRDDGDLEGLKADIQDRIEAAIWDDVTLGANCTQATVRNSDPTAFAIHPLGFIGEILPPIGAFRMDVEVLLRYTP